MKTLEKIILSKPFIISFLYGAMFCLLALLSIGESLIELIINKFI